MRGAPCTIITEGPAYVVAQNMQVSMRLPVPFVREHLPEVEKLPAGDKHIIRVQLVYLRPFACDVTPETPAMRVEELDDGVVVRKDRCRDDFCMYTLAGVSLCNSQATINGYYVRGYRYLGQMHIQMLCSPQLSPDLQAAKDALREQYKQTRELNKQLQSQESVELQEPQQPKVPGKLHRLPDMPSGVSGIVWEADDAVIARSPSLPAGTVAGRTSTLGTAAAISTTTATLPAQSSRKGPYYGGMAMSMQDGAVVIPVKFVSAHMQELAAEPIGTSKAIQVQLVLLPPYASDITVATPATAVKHFGLRDGLTVRKGRSKKPPGVRYPVSGTALATAKPCKEGWFQRGVRLLGPMHIQILCTPKLSPAAEKAKAELLARKRKELQQEQANQPESEPRHEDLGASQQLKQQLSQPANRAVSRLAEPATRASSDGAAAPPFKRLRTSSSVSSQVVGAFAAALAAANAGVITCDNDIIPDSSDSLPVDDLPKYCSQDTAAGAAEPVAAAAEDSSESPYSCGGPPPPANFQCGGSRESTPFSCGDPRGLSCVESPHMTMALPPSPTWRQEQQPDASKQTAAFEAHTLQPKQPVRCQQQHQQHEAPQLEQPQQESPQEQHEAGHLEQQQQESPQKQGEHQQSPEKQQHQQSPEKQQRSPNKQQHQSPQQQQPQDEQQQQSAQQQQLSTDHAAALHKEINAVREIWRRSMSCSHWDGTRGSCTYGDRCPLVESHILGKATAPSNEIRAINDKYRQLRRGQVNSSGPDSGRKHPQEQQLPPVQGLSFEERQRQRELAAGIGNTANSLRHEQQQQSKQGLSYAERLRRENPPAAGKQPLQQQLGEQAASLWPQRKNDDCLYLTHSEKAELAQILTSVDSKWSNLPFRLCRYWNGAEGSCAKRHRCICASTHKHDQPTMHYLERQAAFDRFGVKPDESGRYFLNNRVVRKQQQQQEQEDSLTVAASGGAAADEAPVASVPEAMPESEQQQPAETVPQEYEGDHTAAVQGFSGYSIGDDSDRLSVDSMGWQSVDSDSDAEQGQFQEYLNQRQQQRWQHWQQGAQGQQTDCSLPQQQQQEVDALGVGFHQQQQHCDLALQSCLLQQPAHAESYRQCLGKQLDDHQRLHQQQEEDKEEEEGAEHAANMQAIDGWQSPEASDAMDDDQHAIEQQAEHQSGSAVQPGSGKELPHEPPQEQQQPQQQLVVLQQAFNVQLPPLRTRQLQRSHLSPQRQADSGGTAVQGNSTATSPTALQEVTERAAVADVLPAAALARSSGLKPSSQSTAVVPATAASAVHPAKSYRLLNLAGTSVFAASHAAAAASARAISSPAAAAVVAPQNPLLQPQQSSTSDAATIEQAQQVSPALLATTVSAAQMATLADEQLQQQTMQPQSGPGVSGPGGQLLLQASHSVSSHHLLPIKEELPVEALAPQAVQQHTESAVGLAAGSLPAAKHQAHLQSAAVGAANSSSSGQRGFAHITFNNSNNTSAQLPLLPDNPGSQLTDGLRTELLCLVSVLDKCFPGELDVCDCGETMADIQEDPVAEVRFMKRAYPAVCSAVATDNKEQALKAVKRYLLPK